MKELTIVYLLALFNIQIASQVTMQWERHEQYGSMSSLIGTQVFVESGNNPIYLNHHLGWEYTFYYRISKLNPQNGFTLWSSTVIYSSPSSAFLDSSDNMYVGGTFTSNPNPGRGPFITKYAANGNTVFTILDTAQPYSYGIKMCPDLSGNIYALSDPANRFRLKKYNSNGVLQWTRSYGDHDSINYPMEVIADANNDVIMAGRVKRSGTNYISLIRLNSAGTFTDTAEFQLPNDSTCSIGEIYCDPDLKIYLMGYYRSGGNTNFFMKLNPDFSIVYQKIDTGPAYASRFIVQNDRSVIKRYSGGIIKYDQGGNPLWNYDTAILADFVSASDGYIYATGKFDNNYYTCKINQNGSAVWEITHNYPLMNNSANSVKVDSAKNVYISGMSVNYNPVYYYGSSIKYSQLTGINQTGFEIPLKTELAQNYPNPFNPVTKITFTLSKKGNTRLAIYDLNGKELFRYLNTDLNAGHYEYEWDGSGSSSGVYFVKLTVDNYSQTKRMVLVK